MPQLSVPPHPLGAVPQVKPRAAQVAGVHVPVHTFPVQVCEAPQEPQLSVPPQPSSMVPQVAPAAAQVVGVHALVDFTHAPPWHAENPSAAQSRERVKPSWQKLTFVPSQLARSPANEHSFPVSTHSPASQRFRVPLFAQS